MTRQKLSDRIPILAGDGSGATNNLVDEFGEIKIEANKEGVDVKGKINVEPENDTDAIQIVGPRNKGLGIGYHERRGIEFKSYNQANIKFRIETIQGDTAYPLTIGANTIAFDENVIANWGINLNDSGIKKLADAVDEQDAVNLRTLNKKIDEIPTGGGGDSGPVSSLVDDNGETRVEASNNGASIYGNTIFESEQNNPAIKLQDTDQNEKFKIEHGTFGVTFNNFGDYLFNRDNRSVLELTEKSASFQQSLIANGGFTATDAKVASLTIDNYLDNLFLRMKKDDRVAFEWRTRSNQNQLVIPSSDVYQIMFNDNGNLTTSISFGSGLSMVYSDFIFNSYVQMKNDLDLKNNRIINLKEPEKPTDAVNLSYFNANTAKSVFDLNDVNASVADPLRDDDVLTWDSEANHFRFISKHEFKYAIDATKGVQSCADLVAHYVAYVSGLDGTKKTVFHMKTNSTQHRYTTQSGATHIFSHSAQDSDTATDLVFIGPNGNLFIKYAQFNAGMSLYDNRIERVGDPENPKDAVNLEYLRDYVANHGGTNDEGQIGALDHLQFDGKKVFEVESNAYCLLQDKTDEELLALRVGYDSNTKAINYESRYGTMFQFHSFDEEDKNKMLLFKINRGAARFKVKAYCDAGIDCVNTRIANLRDPSYDGDAINRKYMETEIERYVNENAELNLGNPDNDDYILSSNKFGTRNWIPLPNDKIKKMYLTNGDEAIATASDRIYNKVLSVMDDNLYFRVEGKYTSRFRSDTSENAFKLENRHGTQFQVICYDDSDMNPQKVMKISKDETKFYERPLFAKGLSCGTSKITNLAPPTDPKDGANMQWVQQQISSSRQANTAAVKLAELKLEKALTRIRDLETKLEKFEDIMKVYEAQNKNLAK